MKPEWVVDIRDQSERAGVPFFFKQWGGVNQKRTRRVLDDKTWDEMPEQLERRRGISTDRLQALDRELAHAKELSAGKAWVYVTGLFGRGEASRASASRNEKTLDR